MSSMLRYIIAISALLLLSIPSQAQEDKDSTAATIKPGHQVRIGLDIGKFVTNAINPNKTSYEVAADYYYKKEIYFVVEGGAGKSSVDYSDLAYTSSNSFFRLGFDKIMLPRMNSKDWDGIFFGLRYVMAFVNRKEATFSTIDPLWGTTTGTLPAHQFAAYWGEINAGIRLTLYKGLVTGWNVRGKFLFNATTFRELPPAYIAGFGKGDKSTDFDFNVYLMWAIRW